MLIATIGAENGNAANAIDDDKLHYSTNLAHKVNAPECEGIYVLVICMGVCVRMRHLTAHNNFSESQRRK